MSATRGVPPREADQPATTSPIAGERRRRRQRERWPRRRSGAEPSPASGLALEPAVPSPGTGSIRTAIPFRCAMPARRSRSSGSEEASTLVFAPPAAFATCQPPLVTPAVGHGDRPGDHLVGEQRDRLDLTVRGADPDPLAVADPEPARVVGMDAGAMDAVAGHQLRRVVHPGVVGAQLAQADHPQRELAARARPSARERSDSTSVTISSGQSWIRPPSWRTFCARTPPSELLGEDDAVRVLAQALRAQAAAAAARSGRPAGRGGAASRPAAAATS